jgi:hypothetical protein
MEMLFDPFTGGGGTFILEAFDVEEQTIVVLIQIVEATRTLQPMHDSGKFDGADRVVVVAASRWQGLLVFLVIIVLLGRLLLGCLLSQERDKPCIQGFIV